MLIYFFEDHDNDYANGNNASMYFYAGKTAAEKERRRFAKDYNDTKEERDFWLNEHPLMCFELKGKAMIVDYLNQAAANGYIDDWMTDAEKV